MGRPRADEVWTGAVLIDLSVTSSICVRVAVACFPLHQMGSLASWELEMGLDRPGSKTLVCVHPAATN